MGCSWPRSARWGGHWWTKGCICPRVGPRIRAAVRRRGVPEERRSYRSKTELALELLERALGLGHLKAGWVAGDDAFGMSPTFREGPGGPGDALRAGRSGQHSGLAPGAFVGVGLDHSEVSGVRAPPQAQAQGRAASYHGAAQ